MALNSHGKQNTWDSIHFTYFQVWGKSIVRLKYKVVVVASPKCVCAVWDNTIPSAVPWLCSGCFKFGLRRQVFADKLRIFSLCLYALSMYMFVFPGVSETKHPHCIVKQRQRDLHPSQHFLFILWEYSSSYLQPPPPQGPSELGSSSILSIYFSEWSIVSRCHFPCPGTADQGHEWYARRSNPRSFQRTEKSVNAE